MTKEDGAKACWKTNTAPSRSQSQEEEAINLNLLFLPAGKDKCHQQQDVPPGGSTGRRWLTAFLVLGAVRTRSRNTWLQERLLTLQEGWEGSVGKSPQQVLLDSNFHLQYQPLPAFQLSLWENLCICWLHPHLGAGFEEACRMPGTPAGEPRRKKEHPKTNPYPHPNLLFPEGEWKGEQRKVQVIRKNVQKLLSYYWVCFCSSIFNVLLFFYGNLVRTNSNPLIREVQFHNSPALSSQLCHKSRFLLTPTRLQVQHYTSYANLQSLKGKIKNWEFSFIYLLRKSLYCGRFPHPFPGFEPNTSMSTYPDTCKWTSLSGNNTHW